MTNLNELALLTRRGALGRFAAAALVGAGTVPRALAGWMPATPMPPIADRHSQDRNGLISVGPLLPPDANGLRLLPGFSSRIVARSRRKVAATAYTWHDTPDGGATLPTEQGGWIYVSNSERDAGAGGVSSLVFDASGQIIDAYSICQGTNRSCAGGMTSWGTYLSCEEVSRGVVYECDPKGVKAAVVRRGMGSFSHEAAALDPATGYVYMTEDQTDGCLYRFVPKRPNKLGKGQLEVGCIDTRNSGFLIWKPVPNPNPTASQTSVRYQVSGARQFSGGEGAWIHAGYLYVTTKGDDHVWALNLATSELRSIYDGSGALDGVDNITAASNGMLYVAEDGGNMEVCLLNLEGQSAAVLQLTGHSSSELTGVAFSPDFSRLYFSSQRGKTGNSDGSNGYTFEVQGPFLSLVP